MAELTVTAQYESKPRAAALAALRVTFPVWGLVAPITFAVCFAMVIGFFVAGQVTTMFNDTQTAAFFGVMLTSLLAPCLGLIATKALSDDKIVIDKNGVLLPFVLSMQTGKRYVPWAKVRRIETFPNDESDWRRKKLVFFIDGSNKLSIPLGNLSTDALAQILLASEMWGINCDKDASVGDLQKLLKTDSPNSNLSYTDMWEDELRRRFCATAFMPLEPGRGLRTGTLKVVRQLALGGLSAIYLCQLDEKKLVVLKEAVVPEDSPENIREKAKEMFEREAQLLLKLNHPGVVKVFDHFVEAGRSYLLMEYESGQDLRQFVKQNGAQRESLVLEWAVQIATLLKYIHEQDPPIIHRDLTPDNLVLREDGSIVVIDFGAANEFIGNATGTFVGKQAFIAPEQFRGKACVQSDIYAFGCTLFFLLTGEEPEALSESSPRKVNPDVSTDLDEIVMSCTQMESRDRYQSAAQLLPVLRKLISATSAPAAQ